MLAPTVRIWLQHSHYTPNHQMFKVLDNGGREIIPPTHDPEHDACRHFAETGVTGRMAWRWVGKDRDAGSIDVEIGAIRKAVDGTTTGPITRKMAPSEVAMMPEHTRVTLARITSKVLEPV